MSTTNIPLPDCPMELPDLQGGSRGSDIKIEYSRKSIHKNQDQQQFCDLMLSGAQSAPTAPVGTIYFENSRKRISEKQSWRRLQR